MENVAGFEVRHSYEESKVLNIAHVDLKIKLIHFLLYVEIKYYFLAKLKNGPQSQDHVASDDLYTNPAPKFKYVIPGVNMDAPEIGESDEVPNFEKSVWNDSHVRSISEFMESDLDVSKSNSDKKPWGDYSIDSKASTESELLLFIYNNGL
ncbi:hypothetical protein H4219_000306 [Mycoemilia scoparia]|uniref:Uncharacterized protein n=1 Tax=Mycoemilia scoparia TaxID=417184 RepID=A0A9W8A398_9FUNG|nr:hypothetical protein H4219_000306 [Mycoemilia scoparia]